MGPCANQARERIFHARQIHLQASFHRLRSLRKDIQDHFLAVDHQHPGELFPVPLLRGSEFVIEDDHIRLGFLGDAREFLRFA